ncbi:MAG: GFA family protein [Hyphomicrobiales bacterium]|nr:GFA family protein [Hyphomicrobiales bacterium]
MKIDGRCHCGAIAYTAEVDPETAAICHCADCQSFSGSPFRASVPTKVEDFRLLSGAPKTYVKTADSGKRRVQAFCGECGSPVYASDVESPKILHLRLGAIRQRSEIPPRRQIWRSSALPWAQDISALPSSPRQ